MGNWQLEVAKMAMYIAFPVVIFHWFNQPENFEEWVIKTRREFYPPDKPEQRKMWEDFKRQFNEKEDLNRLRMMEEAQEELEKLTASKNQHRG